MALGDKNILILFQRTKSNFENSKYFPHYFPGKAWFENATFR